VLDGRRTVVAVGEPLELASFQMGVQLEDGYLPFSRPVRLDEEGRAVNFVKPRVLEPVARGDRKHHRIEILSGDQLSEEIVGRYDSDASALELEKRRIERGWIQVDL
jgi:hypothetical protein